MDFKNFKKPSSNQIVGGALFALGVAQMILSGKKEKADRQSLKDELKVEVIKELTESSKKN